MTKRTSKQPSSTQTITDSPADPPPSPNSEDGPRFRTVEEEIEARLASSREALLTNMLSDFTRAEQEVWESKVNHLCSDGHTRREAEDLAYAEVLPDVNRRRRKEERRKDRAWRKATAWKLLKATSAGERRWYQRRYALLRTQGVTRSTALERALADLLREYPQFRDRWKALAAAARGPLPSKAERWAERNQLDAELNGVCSPENLRRAKLRKRGLPEDCWLPPEVAERWQCKPPPAENTPEAIRAWREGLESQIAALDLAGHQDLARELREQRNADQRLLDTLAEDGDWITFREAADLSEALGFPLDVRQISNLADRRNPPFPSRPSKRGGKSKRELPRGIFIEYIITQKREGENREPREEDIRQRIAEANREKRSAEANRETRPR